MEKNLHSGVKEKKEKVDSLHKNIEQNTKSKSNR